MLTPLFYRWERRLASAATDRLVRPFEWGHDWIPVNGRTHEGAAHEQLDQYVAGVLADTDAYFTPPTTDAYELQPARGAEPARLTFPSALVTPHRENNLVHARYFPARARKGGPRSRRAVLVLAQWNSDAGGHVGLARVLAQFGMSALRLSLPYHDARMPPELTRADYIVSSNVGRTLEVCRQAVLDARRAIWWLRDQGYERIGILGTSLGSCLSMLTASHEPLVRAQALNHISPYFADVVWRGLSTRHVREGLEGHITLEDLRRLWMPISPWTFLDRIGDRRTLLVYAKYDLTFPVDLSRTLVGELARRGISCKLSVLPCGHYSTGATPFKYLDGYVLTRFLHANL
jgi:Alpha/beta hydrolase domain containing 18